MVQCVTESTMPAVCVSGVYDRQPQDSGMLGNDKLGALFVGRPIAVDPHEQLMRGVHKEIGRAS